MDRHFRVTSSRHLFWDTMNNGTPVLSRTRADCRRSWTFKGHAKQTWCTSLELNWPFLRRVEADNAKCPEIYFLGHWLAHCETKASLQFYLLGYRAHSSPGHSMSFKGNLYETPFETAR